MEWRLNVTLYLNTLKNILYLMPFYVEVEGQQSCLCVVCVCA